jgi:hypothetical protein
MDGTYRVKAYIEYEIEAPSQEEAIERLTECVLKDLDGGIDIREIAEVAAEKISDKGIDD